MRTNLINDLIKSVVMDNCNKVYTVVVGKANGEHQYCLGQYEEITLDDIGRQLYCDTKGEYDIDCICYAKNGFGFTPNGVFCHCSKMVGTTQKMEEIGSHDLFMVHAIETEKGRSASWFCPVEEIDDKSFDILKIAVLHILEKQSEYHTKRIVWDMEAKAAEMLTQRKIKEAIGCECHWTYADGWNQGYQNQYVRCFDSEREISYEDIKKVIEIFFGPKALDTTREDIWYTAKINRICTTYSSAIYSGYDDTAKTSSRWFWYHHDGTCD